MYCYTVHHCSYSNCTCEEFPNNCNKDHIKIGFDGTECPMCEKIKELEEPLKFIESFAQDGVVSYSLITKEYLHELGEKCFKALGRTGREHNGLPW